jgi:hypothetical protein
MRSRQSSVLETLRRVQGFMDENGDILEAINTSGARKGLDQSIAQLSAHAVDQDAGRVNSQGETARQRALRVALRQAHMRPIALIARARLRDVPEFHALALPPERTTAARLIAAAGAMAEAASVHEQVFVSGGMPTDFVARLLGAADAVRASVDGRAHSRGRRVGATEGLVAEEKRGRGLLKLLDALVVPALGTRDHLVAEWKSLKRVTARLGAPPSPATSSSGTATTGSTAGTSTPTTGTSTIAGATSTTVPNAA